MNLIEYYKKKSLTAEGKSQIDTIRGCILASGLHTQIKRELLDFMTACGNVRIAKRIMQTLQGQNRIFAGGTEVQERTGKGVGLLKMED